MFRHHINLETEHELNIATSLDWSFFKHIRKKSTELDCHQIVDLEERFIICSNAKLFCIVGSIYPNILFMWINNVINNYYWWKVGAYNNLQN